MIDMGSIALEIIFCGISRLFFDGKVHISASAGIDTIVHD
jgi:hypothetical protein